MILTKKEYDLILKANPGANLKLKVDFGLKTVDVLRGKSAAIFKEKDEEFCLDLSEKIKEQFCYLLGREGLIKIAFFDAKANNYYKLMQTADWPISPKR